MPKTRLQTQPGASRIGFGGVDFDNVTMREGIARIDELIRSERPALVVTPNVDHLLRIQKDRDFASVVANADLVLADGLPIVWASRLLGRPLKERVAGSDLFPKLCEHAARHGYRVFFLGGAPGAAEEARRILECRHAALQVVGTHCPPFGFERDQEADRQAVEAVRAARPDILFVGLGSPKQERWIAAHIRECDVPVSIGVGISFSFVAGHVRRAPRWLQRLGLEWAHRLCCEPRRLWRRYLIRGPAFLPLVARELRHRERGICRTN